MTAVRRTLFAVLAATCLAAPNLEAVVPPTSPAAEKAYRHPSLYIPHELRPATDLPPEIASSVEPQAAALQLGGGSAFYDTRAGRLSSLILSEPMVPGTGAGNTLEWGIAGAPADDRALGEAAWAAVRAYVARHDAVLRVDASELGDPRIAVHGQGGLIQIYAPRRLDGVPVRDTGLTAVLNHGNLVLLGLDNWGDAGPAAGARLSEEDAQAVVARHVAPFVVELFPRGAHLESVPLAAGDGYDFRLVWVVRADIQGDQGTWEGLVDAVTGELLAFEDRNQYVVRKALGGVFPVSNDGVGPDGTEQPGFPMPFVIVNTPGGPVTSNAGGAIGCVTGAISTALTGRYTAIVDTCGAVNETSAAGDLDLLFGAGTNCTVPAGHSAGDTHASRTGMYELTRLNEQARGHLPANAWLNGTLTSNMNINLTCNAFWNGATVNFYRQGGGCGNTGEIAAIFDHEWGHGLDNNNVNNAVSVPGEAIADIHAILRLNTSCVGRGFLQTGTCSGYGDFCTTCTGVRDADWANHASGLPHGVSFIQNFCPASGTRGPCNRETHCEGQVVAEAGWDLQLRDLRGAPFNFDLNTALELATRLFYLGSGPVSSWYQCALPGMDGCNATGGYLNLLAADDDNGTFADGTPHMTAIFAAFNRHNLACPTPTVLNGGCAAGPTAAPVLTATAQDQGVSLSWTAVANATRYAVYRTEGVNGASFGKIKIAEVTGTTFLDASTLQNGRPYFFNVLPIGAISTCFGRMSNSASATPAAAGNLTVRPAVTVTVSGGDGDGILDNCEVATFGITVDNTGSGALTNVRVVAVVPLTHPTSVVLTPLPASLAASLADCAAASGTVAVRAAGMAFNDTAQFRIDVTADQLNGQVRSVIVSVPRVESDFSAVATRTYDFNAGFQGWTVASGTFNRIDGGGGNFFVASSTCLDDQCDIVRSPVIRLQAGSTLSLTNRYDTETPTPVPYDRANVGIFDLTTGARTVIAPNGGKLYDLAPGAANGTCETTGQAGWAADTDADCIPNAAFQTSTWTAAALNPGGAFTNRSAQIAIHYGADVAASGYGFQFDNVVLTNFLEQVPDVQSNTCTGCGTITVSPATIPAGTVGTAYSQTFTQTGGTGAITWSVTGALPAGITLNSGTGVLSGTPTQTGSFPITITATDVALCTGTRAVTLVIGCQAITVNPATIPAGTAGTAYSQAFTQTSGIGTVTWSLTGALPTGITLSPTTGVLSGTPTQTGSFPITVRATDANGCFGTRAVTLVIGCQTITVNPATIPARTAGSFFSQTFTQSNGIGTVTWSVTGTLPPGVTLNTGTGALFGTPTQTGSFPITITATDGNGCTGSRAYTLSIICQTIIINPSTIPTGTAGTPYSQTFTQMFGLGIVTWSVTGTLPTGITLNPSTGVLSGTPIQTGTFPITVTATDANGCPGTRSVTLVIDRAGPFVATALAVDATGNSVFEPGEAVVVAPSWRNDTGAAETVTGSMTAFAGPAGATYTITDGAAAYGLVAPGTAASCTASGNCYGLGVSAPSPRPALHWDATVVETLSSTDAKTWTLHVGRSFTDVPTSNGFYRFIETILHKGITGGCTATTYCPTASTTREQMAVFVLVAKEGPGYLPPACGTPMFTDVPASSPFCRWIEELARRGVVGGCGGGAYCAGNPAAREQMAVFVLRTLAGTLNPPNCVAGAEMFADVPASSPFCKWIEELVRRGVVTGCGGGNYCPAAAVTREQMSVFLTVTFGLVLYGV